MNQKTRSRKTLRWLAFLLCLSVSATVFAQATGEVTVWATLGGSPVDVRVVARAGDEIRGVFYSPAAVPGIARFSLPAGNYTLVIEHGAGFARGAEVRRIAV